MGGKSSTRKKVHYHRLTKEEYELMCNLFTAVCKGNPQNGCSYDYFVEFCDRLHPLLAESVIQFYFGENTKWVIKSIREFISLFAYLVRGSIEDQTKVMEIVLLNMIQEKKPKKKFFITGAASHPRKFHALQISYKVDEKVFNFKLENYIKGLICSYIKMEYNCANKEFKSWRRVKAKFSALDIEKLTFTLHGTCSHPKSSKDIEEWVENWKTIKRLHSVVYSYLFGLQETVHYDSLTSLFPLCQSKHRHNVCIMDMCSILYLNSYLPPSCRFKWRLLFSSRIHGVSFPHMLEKIIHEGPSIVVIQDREHYIFGGFAPASWKASHSFHGNCSAFVFQLQPDLQIFEATGRDENYQILKRKTKGGGNMAGLGMGSGKMGNYGWWIEPETLLGNCTDTCSTFKDVPILASDTTFLIDHFEIWGVNEQLRKHHEKRAKRLIHRPQTDLKMEPSNIQDAGKSLLAHRGLKKYTDGYKLTRETQKWQHLEDQINEGEEEEEDLLTDDSDDESEEVDEHEVSDEDDGERSIDWEELEGGSESDDSVVIPPKRKSQRNSHRESHKGSFRHSSKLSRHSR